MALLAAFLPLTAAYVLPTVRPSPFGALASRSTHFPGSSSTRVVKAPCMEVDPRMEAAEAAPPAADAVAAPCLPCGLPVVRE